MTQRVIIGWWLRVFAVCAVFGSATAGGAELASPVCRDEFCFATEADVVGVPLTLRGVSTFRYWGFRVYTGALYMPATETSAAAVLGETPKKLVLRYHRGVSIDQFVEKSEEVLEAHPQYSPEKIRPFLSRMNSLYEPVKKGDAYAITYDPTPGTLSLFFNDRLLGQIHDRDFARAYFGIWVSDYSVSKRFTDELLGRE
jgi:hypothetical protein